MEGWHGLEQTRSMVADGDGQRDTASIGGGRHDSAGAGSVHREKGGMISTRTLWTEEDERKKAIKIMESEWRS